MMDLDRVDRLAAATRARRGDAAHTAGNSTPPPFNELRFGGGGGEVGGRRGQSSRSDKLKAI